MTDIVAFPPFKQTAFSYDVLRPMREGFSMFTQKRFAASDGPARRVATVTVSALAGDRDGAGMVQSFAHMLDGGVNLVRMNAPSVNWFRDTPERLFDVTGPVNTATVTTLDGFDAISVTGLVPGRIFCRAYDILGSYDAGTLTGTARAVRTIKADIDGIAVVPLHSALSAGVIQVGEVESIVFSTASIPNSVQPIGSNWSYTWQFREVLTGEIPAGSTEVTPWG